MCKDIERINHESENSDLLWTFCVGLSMTKGSIRFTQPARSIQTCQGRKHFFDPELKACKSASKRCSRSIGVGIR